MDLCCRSTARKGYRHRRASACRAPILAVTGIVLGLQLLVSSAELRAQASSGATPAIWRGTSAGFLVEWTATNLVVRRTPEGPPVVSVVERWSHERRTAERKGVESGAAPRCSGGNSLRLLSVVGTVVSFREDSDGECEGTVPSWTVARTVALDAARSGAPATLTDFFPQGDLLRALLGDKLVQEALSASPPGPRPTRLAALLERIATYRSEDCRWAVPQDLLSRFAISRMERGRVYVQLGLSHGCEVARGSFTPIMLRLPVPAGWADALARAQRRQEGFLMQDAARLFGRKQTVWSFGSDSAPPELVQVSTAPPLRAVAWGGTGFAALSLDGRIGLTGVGDAAVDAWNLEAGHELRAFPLEKTGLRALAIWTPPAGSNSTGGKVAAGLADGSIFLWNLATGAQGTPLNGHRNDVWAVAFSPDGQRLLSGGADGSVRLWGLATGEELRTFTGHSAAVRAVAFTDGGRSVVSASNDRTVRVWDATGGGLRFVLSGHKGGVWALAPAPAGQLLSGSEDRTVKVWDLAMGRELLTFRGHEDRVRQLAVSPASEAAGALAASSDDTTLRIWNIATGEQVAMFGGLESPITALRFSPDGRGVVAASEDGVKTWALPAAR